MSQLLKLFLKSIIRRLIQLCFAEGKQLAASRDVKFIETSSGIQHNVDELLVGVLKQVSKSSFIH